MKTPRVAPIGAVIRRFRKTIHWSLNDVVAATGMSKGHLSMIENGKTDPSMQTFARICDGMGAGMPAMIESWNLRRGLNKNGSQP